MSLTWTRDPICGVERAVTDVGNYTLSRTAMDVSLLFFNGDIIHRCSSGSHQKNRERAEDHYAARKEELDAA
ncbi:hypothetical protein [Phaeobacter phage MD18]|nr:hypothetical protein [Phaeobacter phage MD18]